MPDTYRVGSEVADRLYVGDTLFWSNYDPTPAARGTDVQGNWIGKYGSRGYHIASGNNQSIVNYLVPGMELTYDDTVKGYWNLNDQAARCLRKPDGTSVGATYMYDGEKPDGGHLQFRFSQGYKGTIWIYAMDWDRYGSGGMRDLTLRVLNGSNSDVSLRVVPYYDGYWAGFPIDIAATATDTDKRVDIYLRRTFNVGGTNAVIQGVFFD